MHYSWQASALQKSRIKPFCGVVLSQTRLRDMRKLRGKINTSEHRARSARSAIHNPESGLEAENEEIVTKDKVAQINEQINDIAEEKEKREKRKNDQKDDNKNNKKAKIKTEDIITKNILKIQSRIHKRKCNLPPVKEIEGEKRYKYKEKHDDK